LIINCSVAEESLSPWSENFESNNWTKCHVSSKNNFGEKSAYIRLYPLELSQKLNTKKRKKIVTMRPIVTKTSEQRQSGWETKRRKSYFEFSVQWPWKKDIPNTVITKNVITATHHSV
jgi:hypothetical protein